MAEAASTDQLPVKLGQEYRVKLGKSFTFPRENAYHTIKYDFKPLSVDPSKSGKLRVAEDEVNVSLPLVQAESTDDVAQFRGPKKPATKECVLIIDTVSGEAVLERISNSIQLKAIRRKTVNPRDRSVSPAPPASLMAQSKATPTAKPATASTVQTSSTKKRPIKTKSQKTMKQDSAAQNGSTFLAATDAPAKKTSKKSTKKPTVKTESMPPPTYTSTGMPVVSTGPSMPVFSLTNSQVSDTTMSSQGSLLMPDPGGLLQAPAKRVKLDSSSSSSDSSSSDSSDSEQEGDKPVQYAQPPSMVSSHMPQLGNHVTPPPGHMTQSGSHMPSLPGHMPQHGGHMTQGNMMLTQQRAGHVTQMGGMGGSHVTQSGQPIGHRPQQHQSTSSSSSDSSDSSSGTSSSDSSDSSDQENDREVASAFTQQQQNIRPRTMSQLRNDLQLSESGSDSDA